MEHFARDIGAVKWHPYNVEAKVISYIHNYTQSAGIHQKQDEHNIYIIYMYTHNLYVHMKKGVLPLITTMALCQLHVRTSCVHVYEA